MALLELKNIGKIYASGGTVAVGVRGVSLSFDRGEFVAVTGESGSGKSTLLNVISGMDSYEEGEMFVEGEPTSHYLEPDWEEYRKQYISFVFQDYNIIESFTVLQNVELALMHLKSAAERRKRAIELLDRVGMKDFAGHKGSRLSGGQKQRTVIARALAKDSPVILADEPTGNLDAATSAEILALLHEVSKDKLLIVVTHDFDEVAGYATRHVRMFDGSVESDRTLRRTGTVASPVGKPEKLTKKGVLSNGLTLGWSIFRSKPLLSFFLCALLTLGALAVFSLTISSGSAMMLFEKSYMFGHIDGRVVVARRDGQTVTSDEVQGLASRYGADGSIIVDGMLEWVVSLNGQYGYYSGLNVRIAGSDGKNLGENAPKKATDVYLSLPLWYEDSVPDTVYCFNTAMTVTGTEFFRNTSKDGVMYVTEEGYRFITALYYTRQMGSCSAALEKGDERTDAVLRVSDMLEKGQYAIAGVEKDADARELSEIWCRVFLKRNVSAFIDAAGFEKKTVSPSYDELTDESGTPLGQNCVFISPADFTALFEEAVLKSESGWCQFSLFFGSDREARDVAKQITGDEYIALPSDTEIKMDFIDALGAVITGGFSALMWVAGVVFIAFFINLCTSRTVGAFSGEMAVMRSMGIPVSVIKAGMYFRMLISAVPAVLLTTAAGIVIFSVPKLSAMFTYISPWLYAVIYLGIFIIVFRVTRKQVKKLFGSSVRQAMRGDGQ